MVLREGKLPDEIWISPLGSRKRTPNTPYELFSKNLIAGVNTFERISVSGFRNRMYSPVLCLNARLLAAAKPIFLSWYIFLTSGNFSNTFRE